METIDKNPFDKNNEGFHPVGYFDSYTIGYFASSMSFITEHKIF